MGDLQRYYTQEEWSRLLHNFDPKLDESQSPPIPNYEMPIVDMMIIELLQRKQVGIKRYGTPLQAHNGRNPLRDALEESIDQSLYLYQAWREDLEAQEQTQAHLQELAQWRLIEKFIMDGLIAMANGPQSLEDHINRVHLKVNPGISYTQMYAEVAQSLLDHLKSIRDQWKSAI